MCPKFCPNCAMPLHAVGMETTDPDPENGWDCFCQACHWSGDIFPDCETEEDLSARRDATRENWSNTAS